MILDIEEIERIVEIKKSGNLQFSLLVFEPSAGVLLSVGDVQKKQNKNQKQLKEKLEQVNNCTNEDEKEIFANEYSDLEKQGMIISFEFIKCLVKNYDEIEHELKYLNINYLGQLVQAVQDEFSKVKDSKKKSVQKSKSTSGESNSEPQDIQ